MSIEVRRLHEKTNDYIHRTSYGLFEGRTVDDSDTKYLTFSADNLSKSDPLILQFNAFAIKCVSVFDIFMSTNMRLTHPGRFTGRHDGDSRCYARIRCLDVIVVTPLYTAASMIQFLPRKNWVETVTGYYRDKPVFTFNLSWFNRYSWVDTGYDTQRWTSEVYLHGTWLEIASLAASVSPLPLLES